MLAALLIAMSAWPPPGVTFECVAGRIENVFPKLSLAAGVPLLFTEQTKDEILVISVKDVPLDKLREKIARAASAEWQTEKEGFRLIRGPKLQKELAEAHIRLVAESVKTAQKNLQKQLDQTGEYTEAFAKAAAEKLINHLHEANQPMRSAELRRSRTDGVRTSLPGWRLLARFATAIDPTVMAKIPPETKAVYSTHPTSRQFAMPAAVRSAVSAYATEVQRLAKHLPEEPEMPREGVDSNIWSGVNLRRFAASGPAKVLISVSPFADHGSAQIRLLAANAKGKIIDQAYVMASPYDGAPVAPFIVPDPLPEEKPIELSKLSQELAEAIPGLLGVNGASVQLSPDLRNYLLHVERFEPAGLQYSDCLIATAKAFGKNLVANPTGSLTAFGRAMGPGGKMQTPSQFLSDMLRPNATLTFEDADGWFTIRPTDWIRSRRTFVPREALGPHLRQAAAGTADLDSLAKLALAVPSGQAFSNAQMYIRLLDKNRVNEYGYNDFGLLRFHGALTAAQRQTAADEGIPCGLLTPRQKAFLESMILLDDGGFGLSWRNDGTLPRGEDEPTSIFDSILKEPTERIGAGLPGSARITLKMGKRSSVACVGNVNGRRNSALMEPGGVAYILLHKERPDLLGDPAEQTEWTEFTLREQTQFEYQLTVSKSESYRGLLRNVDRAHTPVDSVSKFPPEYLKVVQAELAKLREFYKNQKPPPPFAPVR